MTAAYERDRRLLADNLRALSDGQGVVSGMTVAFGNASDSDLLFHGRAQEVAFENVAFVPCERPIDADTVFDLASVTKLFTGVALMQLVQADKLRLGAPIGRYDRRFAGIADRTVHELMCFRVNPVTDGRIDAQTDPARARELLFSMRPGERPGPRYYTDMCALALKYVVEAVADLPFWDYLRQNILLPLGMTHTYQKVPETLAHNTVCYNYERRIVAGRQTVDFDCPVGTVHDPKARILNPDGNDLCGHAGLFSTAGDLVRFAQGLLGERLLPLSAIRQMGTNRTGYPLPDSRYMQYLGYLCFTKHPQQTFSEVPACFGPHTPALSGFTGNHISVDPDAGRFIVMLGNRIHNRVTWVTGRANPYETIETYDWEDGKTYVVSQNFVYRKDRYVHTPIARLLDERF